MEVLAGHMVHFQAIRQVSDADSLTAVDTSDYDHFMAAVHQALCNVVHMHLDTPKIGNEKIARHRDPQLSLLSRLGLRLQTGSTAFTELSEPRSFRCFKDLTKLAR